MDNTERSIDMNTTRILGMTRTRRQGTWQRATRAWLVAMLLAIFTLALTVPALADDPPGGPVYGFGGYTLDPNAPCIGTNQCIKGVQYEAHGTYTLFGFLTMQSAVATVQVSTAAPQKSAAGVWTFPAGASVQTAFSAKQVGHQVEIDNLTPGTAYHFIINAAKGPTGVDDQETGAFTTLKRMVTVTINQITVTDDSDALSAGDLAFNLKVNGSFPAMYPTEDMIAFNPALGSTVEWSSGETRNVGMQVKIATTADQATVLLEGWDWDSEQPGWLNGQPINIDQNTSGIAGDRADVSQTISVNDDEHYNIPAKAVSMQTTNKSLKYKATGTLTISYE
jgi:hypothetical protein